MFGKLCLFCCVIPLVVTAVAMLGMVLWLRKEMNKMDLGLEYTVSDGVLNTFSMTPNKTLDYDLALTITVENKLRANTKIKWEEFETTPVYKDVELGKVDLAPFEIIKVDKKELKPSYKGMKQMSGNVDASKVKNLKFVDIVLKLEAKRKGDTVWSFKVKNKLKYECKLKVPTKSGGEKFESTKCERKK
ncbi:NDR1/HIN1-like protein 10 [Rosa rugosa]|uniref:NDR1/HIN1-like protein 10 n=1 Tax=Rosa rugosa TaxID=74645 RepID=UPI002B40629B|nr:NDR1/HIN1-like protein 10 [Rosa rugosa]